MTQRGLKDRVVVRGAGELASATIRRLSLVGFEVIALEQSQPSCVRRKVCFAEAVFEKEASVEGVTARLASAADEALCLLKKRVVPVLVDPEAKSLGSLKPFALVDARLLKKHVDSSMDMAPVVIGLGPGFVAGKNCHAAVETNRGFNLGRVILHGATEPDTGIPFPVNGITEGRVLRSPADGIFDAKREIGESVSAGDEVATVAGCPVVCTIDGVIRGMARRHLRVTQGQKVGDIDPRGIAEYCFRISDKANAVAGGVMEAVFRFKQGTI